MSDSIEQVSVKEVITNLGSAVVVGIGPEEDRICYKVLVKNANSMMEKRLITPSFCVKNMIIYLLCQYAKQTKEDIAFVMTSVPGKQSTQ